MDIAIGWDAERAVGDWSFAVGDLSTGRDIESAVITSLFSDRLAAPDHVPADGTGDRRGWWGDAYSPGPLGSRLWQLDRTRKVGQQPLLLQARDYCREALQWLIDEGVAARVDVRTQWLSRDALGIEVTVAEPDGTVRRPFRFSWAWRG